MEITIWRKGAKAVAWTHIFLGILDLAWEIVMSVLFAQHSERIKKDAAQFIQGYNQTNDDGISYHGNLSSIIRGNPTFVGNVSVAISTADNDTILVETEHHSEAKNWLPAHDFELRDEVDPNSKAISILLLLVWIRTGVWILGTLIQIWAAVQLLTVTTITNTAKVTIRKCRIYLVVTVIMFLLNIATYVYLKQYIHLGIVTCLHIIAIFLVTKFMQEF